jgi:hypothetical protein
MNIKYITFFLSLLFIVSACGDDKKQASSEPFRGQVFKLLPESQTKVNFNNQIKETAKFNHFYWTHMYNGGGVGIADFNGDGYQDLYFSGNLVADKLYFNEGGMSFKDVTTASGIIANDGWSQGVSVGDVNGDGHPDIYVCRTGRSTNAADRTNLLYVNNGDGTFSEKAKQYGLADEGFSMQASFFDKDNDGDLDLIVGNQPPDKRLEKNPAFKSQMGMKYTSDHLYENRGNGTFVDVTESAGLKTYSHTLNVVASDINDDGWVDLYFSCDYEKPDYLFINDKDGTFTAKTNEQIGHISNFSMGSDVSDFNNDGYKDIFTVDMAANDHYRSKTNMGSMRPARFWNYVEKGWHYQYMSNAMQVNNGNGSFSEVAHLAGLAKTDWSWACLFADFDNDGNKDLAITNGIQRDIRNNDFIGYIKDMNKRGVKEFNPKELVDKIPSNPVKNFIYKNKGDLTFENVTDAWGAGQPGFSNGMAYADLDNDGDLDLVMNNVSAPASIYENQINGSSNYLRVKLEGEPGRELALNSQVTIEVNGEKQTQELTLTRGYFSSVENILHFGLGNNSKIDKVTIDWANGKQSVLSNVEVNQVLTVKENSAQGNTKKVQSTDAQMFVSNDAIDFQHKENDYDDFEREILLPHLQSVQGPFMTSGDVNGDKLDDIFIGGAAGQAGILYIQNANGSFTKAAKQTWSVDAKSEDVGSLFFDADGDGDQDLYVVSGGGEHKTGSSFLRDRLYKNDGAGNFSKASNAIPVLAENGQCVKAADIDGDGDLDLFVGGRGEAGRYPKPAKSFLLQNDGKGNFKDITSANAPEMTNAGMVSDAIFTDYDGDKDLDLIAVGEWMPITIFTNDSGVFKKSVVEKSGGWWWTIAEGDFNKDGAPDYIVGNMGKNHKYKANPEHPFTVFGNDFDDNGTNDVVLANYSGDKLLPVRGRECTSEQMPFVAEKFPTYDGFAKATIETIYEDKLKDAVKYEVHDFYSILLENKAGSLIPKKLSSRAQISPMRAVEIIDINGDGNQDIIACGNLYQAEVETVRHDAGVGLVMLGDGNGNFSELSTKDSGFFANADARDILRVEGAKSMIFVANNDWKVQGFELKK